METAWGCGGRREDLEIFRRSLQRCRIHALDTPFIFCFREPWSNVPHVKWFRLCNTLSSIWSKLDRNTGDASAIPNSSSLILCVYSTIDWHYLWKIMEPHDLRVHEMDLMLSSALLSLERKGTDHLKILRTIATGENSLFSNNHTLPMFCRVSVRRYHFWHFFPKVGGDVLCAYDYWAKNSVGDIIEMLMQMLEVGFAFYVLPLYFFVFTSKVNY